MVTQAIRSSFARRSVATSNDVRQCRLLQISGPALHCLNYDAAKSFDLAILPRARGLDEPGRFARHHREDLRGRDRYEPVARRPPDDRRCVWRRGCVAERGLAGGRALAGRAAHRSFVPAKLRAALSPVEPVLGADDARAGRHRGHRPHGASPGDPSRQSILQRVVAAAELSFGDGRDASRRGSTGASSSSFPARTRSGRSRSSSTMRSRRTSNARCSSPTACNPRNSIVPIRTVRSTVSIAACCWSTRKRACCLRTEAAKKSFDAGLKMLDGVLCGSIAVGNGGAASGDRRSLQQWRAQRDRDFARCGSRAAVAAR